jgi:hypothetical protein
MRSAATQNNRPHKLRFAHNACLIALVFIHMEQCLADETPWSGNHCSAVADERAFQQS